MGNVVKKMHFSTFHRDSYIHIQDRDGAMENEKSTYFLKIAHGLNHQELKIQLIKFNLFKTDRDLNSNVTYNSRLFILSITIMKAVNDSPKIRNTAMNLQYDIFSEEFEKLPEKFYKLPNQKEFDAFRDLTVAEVYTIIEYIFGIAQIPEMNLVYVLIYLDRLVTCRKVEFNRQTWKKLLIIIIILASKAWSDQSIFNIAISNIFAFNSLDIINKLYNNLLKALCYGIGITEETFKEYEGVFNELSELISKRIMVLFSENSQNQNTQEYQEAYMKVKN